MPTTSRIVKYFLKRTLAYFIDCIICYAVVMLLIQWAILSNVREAVGLTDEWFQNSINLQLYVLFTISIPVWLYFTYFDSNKSNGTFGKRLMRVKVTNRAGQKISWRRSFCRAIAKLLPWEIAHIGVIFPTPIYYSESPDLRMLTIAGILLFGAYVISIWVSPKRQTLYDLILSTRVTKQSDL